MEKIIIAAVSENNVIGKDGDIPWDIPEDMTHFKKKTTGNTVIMGRKTYESLPDSFRPLPGRRNIVLTRSGLENKPKDVIEASSLKDAWNSAEKFSEKAFLIGGESVYRKGLSKVDKLEITRVHDEYDGDTYFPEINSEEWMIEEKDERDGFSFVTYSKR